MTIPLNEKLQLSARPNILTLFNDQVFIKAYNESAYLLSYFIGKSLKPIVFKTRHKPFYTVVMVSYPKKALSRYLPNLRKTDFGFELTGNYDLSTYTEWFINNQFLLRT